MMCDCRIAHTQQPVAIPVHPPGLLRLASSRNHSRRPRLRHQHHRLDGCHAHRMDRREAYNLLKQFVLEQMRVPEWPHYPMNGRYHLAFRRFKGASQIPRCRPKSRLTRRSNSDLFGRSDLCNKRNAMTAAFCYFRVADFDF